MIGPAKLDGDTREMLLWSRRSTAPGRLWSDPHQLLQPFDLAGFNSDSPLPLGAALKVVDGHGPTAQNERPSIRLGKPVVEARPGNSQALGRVSR